MAEGAPLLREYRLIPYRGFESLSLRHMISETFLNRRCRLAPNPFDGESAHSVTYEDSGCALTERPTTDLTRIITVRFRYMAASAQALEGLKETP